jgi:hypothetical protein
MVSEYTKGQTVGLITSFEENFGNYLTEEWGKLHGAS